MYADSTAVIPLDGEMETLAVSENTICAPSISSAADSPARISVTPESAPESTANVADCGPNMREAFANFDRATSSWKTSQLCLDGEWSEFSETSPRAGMTRNGKAFELPTLARLTEGNESGFLPTPNVAGGGNPPEILTPHKGHFVRPSGKKAHFSLDQYAKMFPTPSSRDGKDSPGMSQTGPDGRNRLDQLARVIYATPTADDANNATRESGAFQSLTRQVVSSEMIGGQLNPTWVEWLMGYPLGWTALKDSETPSSRKSRNTSAAASSKPKKNARRARNKHGAKT
jgi:hypothetical protein